MRRPRAPSARVRSGAIAVGRLSVAAVLGVFAARRALLMAAALLPARGGTRDAGPHSVCVIVPARNERRVLERSLQALAELRTARLSVVLVDDGSCDGTLAVMERFARPRTHWTSLRLDPAAGKGAALNAGIAAAPLTDLIVVCDADVLVEPDCVDELVGAFADPRVGAASGVLWPANADQSIVTRYCALELWQHQLITSAGKDRLGLDPPAHGWLSCYRREALEQIDGFAPASLGEDVRATNAVVHAGWRTRFVATARVTGDVPATVADYWWQHIRWARGLHSAAPSRHHHGDLSVARQVEAWLHAAGYLDRGMLLLAAVIAAFGGMPTWVPAGYAGLTAGEAICALALAGDVRRAPRFAAASLPMAVVDVGTSLAGLALALVRAETKWHSPVRRQSRSASAHDDGRDSYRRATTREI
jgi:GT2 family glycosyltransferase